MPLHVPEAIEAAFSGQDTRIDVCTALFPLPDGESDKRDLVVMAGVGIDTRMIVNTDDELRKRGGFLAHRRCRRPRGAAVRHGTRLERRG